MVTAFAMLAMFLVFVNEYEKSYPVIKCFISSEGALYVRDNGLWLSAPNFWDFEHLCQYRYIDFEVLMVQWFVIILSVYDMMQNTDYYGSSDLLLIW